MANLVELDDSSPVTIGDVVVQAYPVRHRPETRPHALRLELGGVTIGYTGDSEWTDGIASAGRDADLFIAEAYKTEPIGGHMSLAELTEHLPALACRRVLLTHASGEVLESTALPPGCTLAFDGLELRISPAAAGT